MIAPNLLSSRTRHAIAVWLGQRRTGAHLHCDVPTTAEVCVGEAVLVRGWAHAADGIACVEVSMNGNEPRLAAYGSVRRDVAAELGDDSAVKSGWQIVFPAGDVAVGQNTIGISAKRGGGGVIKLDRAFSWRDYGVGESPYDQVDLSGERYDPRYPLQNSVAIEHLARYRFAASFAAGRRVLDAGCGFGYGAEEMGRAGAESVDAIDASTRAIERAARVEGTAVRYVVGDVRHLPYPNEHFDLVVCFEVLEHMIEHDELLAELRRVMRPGAQLIISTPNRGKYHAGNPWHLRELTTTEFVDTLRRGFRNVDVLGQQLHLATMLASADVHAATSTTGLVNSDVLKLSGTDPGDEVYSVAVASNAPLPASRALVALGDPREELIGATIASWTERALQAEAEAAMLRTRLAASREHNFVPVDTLPAPTAAPAARETREGLHAELQQAPPWMFDWDLGSLGTVPVVASLPDMHRTQLELLTPAVRAVLAEVGPGATVLDLACCEGWFAHRMLDMGAARVVGIDVRDANIRRATLVRDHLGISPRRLQFHQADVFALPDLDRFDIVLMLGLVYHQENPVGAMRIARALTRRLCVVESQLTEQRAPIIAGDGSPDRLYFRRAESFGAWFEEDQGSNPSASHGGVLSLIPNEAALVAMGRVAGFADVTIAQARPDHEAQYRRGERAVMLASAGGLDLDQARASA